MTGLRIIRGGKPFVPEVKPVPPEIADELRAYLKKVEWKEQDGGCFCGKHFVSGPSIKAFLAGKS